jgi:hypothetical protein
MKQFNNYPKPHRLEDSENGSPMPISNRVKSIPKENKSGLEKLNAIHGWGLKLVIKSAPKYIPRYLPW